MSQFGGGLLPGTLLQLVTGGEDGATAGAGVDSIRAHDPAFDKDRFLAQAQRIFHLVKRAGTEQRADIDRQVVGDALWQDQANLAAQEKAMGRRTVFEDATVETATIAAASSDATWDTVVVRFVGTARQYRLDTQTQKVVEGSRTPGPFAEEWVFQRNSAAVTTAGAGTLEDRCPGCGAPLQLDQYGACNYCHVPVSSGRYDWVLTRVARAEGAQHFREEARAARRAGRRRMLRIGLFASLPIIIVLAVSVIVHRATSVGAGSVRFGVKALLSGSLSTRDHTESFDTSGSSCAQRVSHDAWYPTTLRFSFTDGAEAHLVVHVVSQHLPLSTGTYHLTPDDMEIDVTAADNPPDPADTFRPAAGSNVLLVEQSDGSGTLSFSQLTGATHPPVSGSLSWTCQSGG